MGCACARGGCLHVSLREPKGETGERAPLLGYVMSDTASEAFDGVLLGGLRCRRSLYLLLRESLRAVGFDSSL